MCRPKKLETTELYGGVDIVQLLKIAAAPKELAIFQPTLQLLVYRAQAHRLVLDLAAKEGLELANVGFFFLSNV
jgi:hypothetical protein